jgi:adenosylcobinamide-GDP ribazoletransferase
MSDNSFRSPPGEPPGSRGETSRGSARPLWRPEGWLDDLRLTFAFLTRLPVSVPVPAPRLAEAARVFPLAGALVGLAGGLVYAAGLSLGLPALAAALFALAATALSTGALHEDGLADTADGLGGGRDRAERLAIMSDSRIGSFGVLALLFSVLARASLLAALPAWSGLAALVAAHALGRAVLPLVMARGHPAKTSGLGASAGTPPDATALTALAIGAVLAYLALGPIVGALTLAAALAAAYALARLARRLIGGYTGDILGAIEQLGEIAVLAAAVAAA